MVTTRLEGQFEGDRMWKRTYADLWYRSANIH